MSKFLCRNFEGIFLILTSKGNVMIEVRSKDSQVKTKLVLWIFILFKVTRFLYFKSFVLPTRHHTPADNDI